MTGALIVEQDGGVLAEGAKIGLPELDLGTVPAWGGSVRLPKTIGRDHVLDMILRAKKIDGEHALRIGLVHELHPTAELEAAAHQLAVDLAAMPPQAVAGVLRKIVGGADLTLDDALAEERRAVLACSGFEDQLEGMQAFLEKRRPVFTGE